MKLQLGPKPQAPAPQQQPAASAQPFTLKRRMDTPTPASKPQASEASAAPEKLQAHVPIAGGQIVTMPDPTAAQSVETFNEFVLVLRGNFDDKPLMSQVMRRILYDLNTHPEYEELLLPEDIGLMLQTLERNYGMAVEAKVAKSRKKPAGKGKIDLAQIEAALVDLSF